MPPACTNMGYELPMTPMRFMHVIPPMHAQAALPDPAWVHGSTENPMCMGTQLAVDPGQVEKAPLSLLCCSDPFHFVLEEATSSVFHSWVKGEWDVGLYLSFCF